MSFIELNACGLDEDILTKMDYLIFGTPESCFSARWRVFPASNIMVDSLISSVMGEVYKMSWLLNFYTYFFVDSDNKKIYGDRCLHANYFEISLDASES